MGESDAALVELLGRYDINDLLKMNCPEGSTLQSSLLLIIFCGDHYMVILYTFLPVYTKLEFFEGKVEVWNISQTN